MTGWTALAACHAGGRPAGTEPSLPEVATPARATDVQSRDCAAGVLHARQAVVTALDEERPEDALAAVDRVLALSPDDPHAHAMRALLLFFLEAPSASADAWAEALARAPDRTDWRSERVQVLFEAARYEEAAEEYERLWEAGFPPGLFDTEATGADEPPPDGFDGWTVGTTATELEIHDQGGWSHLYAGDLAAALRAFDRLRELFPECSTGHEGAGWTLHLLGRQEQADEALARALALEPEAASFRNDIGLEHLEAGRRNEALLCLDLAVALAPEDADVRTNHGWALFELGRIEEALAEQDRAIELRPELAVAHYNRGLELSALGRYAEAVAAYDRALELGSGPERDADAHYCRGNVLLRLDDPEGAAAAYGRALELEPSFPEPWYNRGVVRLQLGRVAEARADFERYLELDPGDADAQARLRECDERIGAR